MSQDFYSIEAIAERVATQGNDCTADPISRGCRRDGGAMKCLKQRVITAQRDVDNFEARLRAAEKP